MADEIKQAAVSGQQTGPEADVFAEVQGTGNEYNNDFGDTFVADKGITGGIGVRQDDASPLETPSQHPDLEVVRKSMQADYTRKTQELAEQRRELERQMAYMAQMQQMQQQGQQPTQAQAREIRGILDRIPPTVRANMEPEAQQVLETLETVVRDEVDSRVKSLMNSEEITGIRREIEQLRAQQWLSAKQAESSAVLQRYGQDRVQPYSNHIANTLRYNPNMSVEQALMQVAPHVVQQYWMEQGVRHAQTQKQRQQQAQLEALRSGPSADPTMGYREGESMMDSARAVLGASLANLEQ